MANRPLSPGGFRGRSRSNAGTTAAFNDILFPKVYEQAWGNSKEQGGDDRSDIERARIFLLRFRNMNADPATGPELRAIVMDQQQHQTIPAIAHAVQTRIFRNRHETFAATPVLQAIRFILIKGRIPEVIVSGRTRAVIDFFFDPTLARNLVAPPDDPAVYQYPAGRLKVCIVGGGPTALASAISLAEKGAGKVEVHMYGRRWVEVSGPNGTYIDYPPTARRRDQVVTLQDSVTTLMSPKTYEALFAGRPEKVWPGSANIQIRKVEDRLLRRCQDQEFWGLIHLHAEGLFKEDLAKAGDFHVLLGADGAASWVRKSYFHGYENERGRSYALGLAFNRPAGLPWSQPLNVFLTLGQTRYLLNASDFDGRGYLNMQLTEDEWHKMVSVDGRPVTFGNPGCLRLENGGLPDGFTESQVFAPSMDRNGTLWGSIEDGLKLFGFKESEVINVVRIPIVVQAVQEGVQYLPLEDSGSISRPHALVAVSGDAAMTVHFWPGRGLNSGIKAGMALGDELVHALNNGRFVGLPLDAMKEYNDFILKLQGREHDKRSIPILNQSGSPEMLGWLLEKAQSVPDNVAVEWLVGAMAQIASRLETRNDWAFDVVPNIEPQIRIVLRQLRSLTLREMAVSFPWPTREMAGAEVLPIRSMKPEEKQDWLQGLWKLIKDETSSARSRAPSRSDGDGKLAPPTGRFEAPRTNGRAPSPSPNRLSVDAQGLRRSGARSVRGPSPSRFENLKISSSELDGTESRGRSTSPAPGMFESNLSPSISGNRGSRSPSSGGEVSLVRMMSTNQRPGKAVLSDALSLALFRVGE